MRRVLAIIISAVCLLVLITGFFTTHFFIDGKIFSIFSRSADLSGAEHIDIEKLERFISLQQLDISGAGLDNQAIADICEVFPECEIIYTVMVGGAPVDSRTKSFSLDDSSAWDCIGLLMLSELECVDITACTTITDSMRDMAQSAACEFMWKMNLCGEIVTSDQTQLTLQSPTADDLEKLYFFRNLEKVSIYDCDDYPALKRLAADFPECEFVWSVDLCGVEVLSTDISAVIADHKVDDFDDFAEKLSYLPSLEYIDMCRCGLSNEQMEVLMERYPDIKFVWEITFGRYPVMWTVRTDIVCFSSLGMVRCDDEQLAPLLKYCTDLVALDLGHHNITDLAPFANLKKLKVLILGDNPITDLSPLAALSELQYIEIFSCHFTDVSALAQLPNLTDICIGNNAIKDITPFLSMKQLDSLWVPLCGLDSEERDALSEALPDCTIKFSVRAKNPMEGWRVTEMNMCIRKAFNNWRYVTEFNNWDDVTYMDGVELVEVETIELG